MRRVAGEKHAALAIALGDQRIARRPVEGGNDAQREVRAGGTVDHRGRVAHAAVPGAERRDKQELVPAVDRDEHGADFGVEDPVLPGRALREPAGMGIGLEIGRVHRPAHHRADHPRLAHQLDPERGAHAAARPVATDQVVGLVDDLRAAVAAPGDRGNAVAAVVEFLHAPAETHLHRGERVDRLLELGFEKQLRAAMRRLGRGPAPGPRRGFGQGKAPRRLRVAAELIAGEPGEIGEVGRVVVVQAPRSHRCGEAEPAEMLHGPARYRVGLGMGRRGRPVVEQRTADAAAAELDRRHHADRAAAGDDH